MATKKGALNTGAPASSRRKRGTSNVIVCYNDPCDIIFNIDGKPVKINGNTTHLRGQTQGHLPVGAYGMTNIDAAVWEKIKSKYGKLPAIKTGRLFASETKDAAESESKDRKSLKSGKEPVKVEG